jgi:hypothetical protein
MCARYFEFYRFCFSVLLLVLSFWLWFIVGVGLLIVIYYRVRSFYGGFHIDVEM